MRKVVLSVAISLDGFIEGPNGEYDWCFTDQDYGMSEFFNRIDSIFMGRKSYELALTMGDNPMPGFPKLKEYVFSNTMKEVKEGAVLVKGDILSEVNKIKSAEGKNIWLFGEASLTSSLLQLKLIDEISHKTRENYIRCMLEAPLEGIHPIAVTNRGHTTCFEGCYR